MSFGMLGKARAQKVEKPFERLSLTEQTTLIHRWLRRHPRVLAALVERESARREAQLRSALALALATVCTCSPELGEPHKDSCHIWQHGFTAARELLGIRRG